MFSLGEWWSTGQCSTRGWLNLKTQAATKSVLFSKTAHEHFRHIRLLDWALLQPALGDPQGGEVVGGSQKRIAKEPEVSIFPQPGAVWSYTRCWVIIYHILFFCVDLFCQPHSHCALCCPGVVFDSSTRQHLLTPY